MLNLGQLMYDKERDQIVSFLGIDPVAGKEPVESLLCNGEEYYKGPNIYKVTYERYGHLLLDGQTYYGLVVGLGGLAGVYFGQLKDQKKARKQFLDYTKQAIAEVKATYTWTPNEKGDLILVPKDTPND